MGSELHNRLMKIAGQVNAIDRMIESSASPLDVLTQIHAAKSAITKVAEIVASNAICDKVLEEDTETVKELVKRFSGLS